ncbi:serine protease [Chitinivorax tropicus]|uniref:Serine protease n=1 Tax=Chitinivorax tropicus TaxID=714531 RepID=A0A840MMZ9_9PROT|nr:S8 family peptidase [Chitinivorax tropicus]MBB5018337.1 serine protease [Chitinivorax tropicus]
MKSVFSLLAGLLIVPSAMPTYASDVPASAGRVIVKFKANSPSVKLAQSAEERRSRFAQIAGSQQITSSHLTSQLQVIHAADVSSAELVARFAKQNDVEYAVPSERKFAKAIPSDPHFNTQWYLQSTEPGAINAIGAWDLTRGSSKVAIAVLDTGIRLDHPDFSNKLLPGYDFISVALDSNDGDGRDSDPSDTGTFMSTEDINNPYFATCPIKSPTNSSWHGTKVAGIAAAIGDNALGIAGVNWGAKILPVRVLGKCGGFDDDIIAGMLWAGGISVPGVPDNPNPARVLNMSIGGTGSCTAPYQDAITQLAAKGVLVVTVSGNESATSVTSPGNCNGVLTVSAVRNDGLKPYYANTGPETAISAPGGQCKTTPCVYGISTTSNTGLFGPEANSYAINQVADKGTSFAAPIVAGVAAMMMGTQPLLTPNDVIQRIKSSARPFPTNSSLPACPTTAKGADDTEQCNCTTATCGAGILDAKAAIEAATSSQAIITGPTTAEAGVRVTLDISKSALAEGRTIRSVKWTLVDGAAITRLDSDDNLSTSFRATGTGTVKISVTITDSAGATSSTSTSINITAATGNGSGGGSSGGGAVDWLAAIGLLGLLAGAYRRNR